MKGTARKVSLDVKGTNQECVILDFIGGGSCFGIHCCLELGHRWQEEEEEEEEEEKAEEEEEEWDEYEYGDENEVGKRKNVDKNENKRE